MDAPHTDRTAGVPSVRSLMDERTRTHRTRARGTRTDGRRTDAHRATGTLASELETECRIATSAGLKSHKYVYPPTYVRSHQRTNECESVTRLPTLETFISVIYVQISIHTLSENEVSRYNRTYVSGLAVSLTQVFICLVWCFPYILDSPPPSAFSTTFSSL